MIDNVLHLERAQSLGINEREERLLRIITTKCCQSTRIFHLQLLDSLVNVVLLIQF